VVGLVHRLGRLLRGRSADAGKSIPESPQRLSLHVTGRR
jgi:hypothetical protein